MKYPDNRVIYTIMTSIETKKENRSWVTLVMKGDNYIPGAQVVAQSLKSTAIPSKYPSICMITDDVKDYKSLLKVYDKVVIIPYIEYNTRQMFSAKQEKIYSPWSKISFTKWNLLKFKSESFTVYTRGSLTLGDSEEKKIECLNLDKVIFLDSDLLITENIDDLFDLSAPAAIFSWPDSKPYLSTGISNPYGVLKHGQYVNNLDIKKAMISKSFVGMGGIVLIEPNIKLYNLMIKILNASTKRDFYGHRNCLSMFDEQIIAETYMHVDVKWTHIHQVYGFFVGKTHWNPEKLPIKVLHYYGTKKPWQMKRDEWPDLKEWFDIFDTIEITKNG